MSKSLALLSGKGGSGKTTLALSIASMLSNCGLKVLLIDCDLSTNGATYFYESKISENVENTNSFYEMYIDEYFNDIKFIKINEFMDFMPSITQINKQNTETYQYNEKDLIRAEENSIVLKSKYDIVLYDCQAGYTDVLKLILPFTDVNLVVMEADAISSAAIRSFYLKIGNIINEKKVYQIFNKATDEEYDIYSKIGGGTFFTNIETVMFDWKIRKSFSIAQIPDMENSSAQYGEQVYNICKVLFKEEKMQEKLKRFETVIYLNKLTEDEKLMRTNIEKLNNEDKTGKNKLVKAFFSLAAPIFMVLTISIFSNLIDEPIARAPLDVISMLLATILVFMIVIMSLVIVYDLNGERRNRYKQLNSYNKKLNEIMIEKEKVQEQYKSSERDKI